MKKRRTKLKLIKFLLPFSLLFCSYAKAPKNFYQVRKIVSKYKKEQVVDNLRAFVRSGKPTRLVGTPGHEKARDFLIKRLQKMSSGETTVDRFKPDIDFAIKDYQDEFKREVADRFDVMHATYKLWDGFTSGMLKLLNAKKNVSGTNIVWEKKGSQFPNEVIIVGANYDTIIYDQKTLIPLPDKEAPGADNNGSGVALALSLVELLNGVNIPRTVRVVFSDFDELRFLGSRDFADKLSKKEEIAGYINLVMLGHDSKRTDRRKKLGNMKLYGRKGSKLDKTLADILTKAGNKIERGVDFKYVANSFNSSGHISFWGHEMAVLTFTQNWDDDFNHDRYHTSNDFVETLNLKTYYNCFQYIAGGIIAWNYDLKK